MGDVVSATTETAVSELFEISDSSVALDTRAMLDTDGIPSHNGTTVTVREMLASTAIDETEGHVTVPPEKTPPPEASTNCNVAGSSSLSTTSEAAYFPLFTIVMVYVYGVPVNKESGSDLEICRSGSNVIENIADA
ncbi:hypothetical protein DSECCO2_614220 [anaerobic digester metagenome]